MCLANIYTIYYNQQCNDMSYFCQIPLNLNDSYKYNSSDSFLNNNLNTILDAIFSIQKKNLDIPEIGYNTRNSNSNSNSTKIKGGRNKIHTRKNNKNTKKRKKQNKKSKKLLRKNKTRRRRL